MKRTIGQVLDSGECDVYHPVTGEYIFMLNVFILNAQDAWQNLEAIKDMHMLKQIIYIDIEQENNGKRLKELALDLQEVEFELQRLWGFTEDARYHKFWQYPKCTCPQMDNEDRYGTKYKIVNQQCPLHGDKA